MQSGEHHGQSVRVILIVMITWAKLSLTAVLILASVV